MTSIAISVSGIGKAFKVLPKGGTSARHQLDRLMKSPFARPAPDDDRFWALRDISFEVGRGEVVGIVGRNGAGKSVLLKILSRVMRPTCGRIELRGTVAPMLEVGTGFHPDLTGRENIYLNGVILGMRRSEVHRRIDEIVAFSGVEPFLDTPVRQFSSGMRMRLAFAVAVHLDREIFLLDEVLAVGDRDYQERCRARLRVLADAGRTIVIVSHGDFQMERFCSRAVLIDGGRLVAAGDAPDVYEHYRTLRRTAVAA